MRRLFNPESELGFDSDSEKTYFDLEVHVDWCSANTLIWWSSILISTVEHLDCARCQQHMLFLFGGWTTQLVGLAFR